MFDAAPKDTRGTLARFGYFPQKNAKKSLEAGRPIFDDVPYIEILFAGNKTERVHRPATVQDQRDYPREWAAFQQNRDQEAVSGTPLKDLPGITAGLVEEARYFKIVTVEQLAEMPETAAQQMGMGWPGLRRKARDYIAAAQGDAPAEKLRKELEQRDAKIAALERQIAEIVQAQGRKAKKAAEE